MSTSDLIPINPRRNSARAGSKRGAATFSSARRSVGTSHRSHRRRSISSQLHSRCIYAIKRTKRHVHGREVLASVNECAAVTRVRGSSAEYKHAYLLSLKWAIIPRSADAYSHACDKEMHARTAGACCNKRGGARLRVWTVRRIPRAICIPAR